jgi:Na+-transporting NADH:ubiquinone oxidoreductase subunit NqrC
VMIVSLVTTVVGLAATYYVLKEMQKQTDQAAKQ